jgi:hypothetical protein
VEEGLGGIKKGRAGRSWTGFTWASVGSEVLDWIAVVDDWEAERRALEDDWRRRKGLLGVVEVMMGGERASLAECGPPSAVWEGRGYERRMYHLRRTSGASDIREADPSWMQTRSAICAGSVMVETSAAESPETVRADAAMNSESITEVGSRLRLPWSQKKMIVPMRKTRME